jgi:hypothetical protein
LQWKRMVHTAAAGVKVTSKGRTPLERQPLVEWTLADEDGRLLTTRPLSRRPRKAHLLVITGWLGATMQLEPPVVDQAVPVNPRVLGQWCVERRLLGIQ